MTGYVAGFLFSQDLTRVALIRKARPSWQRGMLNGIGGKIEPGETSLDAMRREFREEAGSEFQAWEERIVLRGHDWCVHFFSGRADRDLLWALSADGDEPIVVCQTGGLPDHVLPNLRWLIPLVMDPDVAHAEVREFGADHAAGVPVSLG